VWRHWLAELSRRFRLIRYDERGCGLSDWDIARFSFDEWVDDPRPPSTPPGWTDPAARHLPGRPVAIAYAVRHPERVSHLVLLGSYAQGRRKRARTFELELPRPTPRSSAWAGAG
jgi:pimeloyl-ACP methyl ester carboxylesterase